MRYVHTHSHIHRWSKCEYVTIAESSWWRTLRALILLFFMFEMVLHVWKNWSWQLLAHDPCAVSPSPPLLPKGATGRLPEASRALWIPKEKRGKSGKTGMARKANSCTNWIWSCPFSVIEKNEKGTYFRLYIYSEEFSFLPFSSLPRQVLKTSPPNFLHSDVQGSLKKG